MDTPIILIVDDETINLKLLQEILQYDYTILMAKNGREALALAIEHIPDIILLDIMMPGMDGYEVCQELKKKESTTKIPVIFITALGLEEDETKGFEFGAVDYITKPVKPSIVQARVNTHIELKRIEKQLANQNEVLEEKVRQRTKDLSDSRLEIVHRLMFAAEYKDPDTGSHIQRMSHYSERIARAWGLSEKECELVLLASPMHDIGKMGIPDSILLKPSKLDRDEWEIMKTHTMIGAKILSQSRSLLIQTGQEIAVTHHEKWDGTGYPNGLSHETIPLFGRITAIADVFDALTTKRPYKKPWTVDAAVTEMIGQKEKHFDPDLIQVFLNILPDLLTIKERFPE